MQEDKPDSIKTIGLVVSIFSGFIIFTNSMGALAWTVLGFGGESENQTSIGFDPISYLFNHYVEMCLVMLTIGVIFLIGGIFIRKYKLWANQLTTGISLLLLLIIWSLMIGMAISISHESGTEMFVYGAIFTAVFWSIPIVLLIYFLNKKKIKKHFT